MAAGKEPKHLDLWPVVRAADDYWSADFIERQCMSCIHYQPLAGNLGMDWGVCANPQSERAGLLSFEHMGCVAWEADETVGDPASS